MIASIVSDVNLVITMQNQLLLLLSSALIVVALVCTLLAVDWVIAVGASVVIALVYAAAMAVTKRPLKQLGRKNVVLNQRLIQSLQEGLGAIRDVQLDGSQPFYSNIYRHTDKQLRLIRAQSVFLSSYPRLVMEPAGMVVIALMAYLLVLQGGIAKAIPMLGTLALGLQRLLPMAQKVYEGWATTRSTKSSLIQLLALLDQPLPADAMLPPPPPLALRQSIRMEGVRFRYGPELPEVLAGLDLEIRSGERIGVIGSSGSGKSTLVDLLIGLLEPTAGRILIDGDDLHGSGQPQRLAAWRATIAHVPQSIYLADSSIAENIAFGIPKQKIDLARVRKAAEQAKCISFIESCPEGYRTLVGEKGIRLSGGQRQRIGIARALYKQAQVLVLDEATAKPVWPFRSKNL